MKHYSDSAMIQQSKYRLRLQISVMSLVFTIFSSAITAQETNGTPQITGCYGCEFVQNGLCDKEPGNKPIRFKFLRENCVAATLLSDNANPRFLIKKLHSTEDSCQNYPSETEVELNEWTLPLQNNEQPVEYTLTSDKLIVLFQPKHQQGYSEVNVHSLNDGNVEKALWVMGEPNRFCNDTLYTFSQGQNKAFIYSSLSSGNNQSIAPSKAIDLAAILNPEEELVSILSDEKFTYVAIHKHLAGSEASGIYVYQLDESGSATALDEGLHSAPPDSETPYQIYFQDMKPVLLAPPYATSDLKKFACSISEEIDSRKKRSPLSGCKELLASGFRLGCENRVITGCSGGVNSGGAEAEGSGTCTNSMSNESCTFQTTVDGTEFYFSDSVTCPSCNAVTGSLGSTKCTPQGCIDGCPAPPPTSSPTPSPTPHFPRTKCDPDGQTNWTDIYYFDCRNAIQTDCTYDYGLLTYVSGTCINPKSGGRCNFTVWILASNGITFACQDGCSASHLYGDWTGWETFTKPNDCMVRHYVPTGTSASEIIGISVGTGVGGIVVVGTAIAIFAAVVYKLRHRGYQAISEN